MNKIYHENNHKARIKIQHKNYHIPRNQGIDILGNMLKKLKRGCYLSRRIQKFQKSIF